MAKSVDKDKVALAAVQKMLQEPSKVKRRKIVCFSDLSLPLQFIVICMWVYTVIFGLTVFLNVLEGLV